MHLSCMFLGGLTELQACLYLPQRRSKSRNRRHSVNSAMLFFVVPIHRACLFSCYVPQREVTVFVLATSTAEFDRASMHVIVPFFLVSVMYALRLHFALRRDQPSPTTHVELIPCARQYCSTLYGVISVYFFSLLLFIQVRPYCFALYEVLCVCFCSIRFHLFKRFTRASCLCSLRLAIAEMFNSAQRYNRRSRSYAFLAG